MSGQTASTDLPTVSEEGGIRYLHFDSPWVQGAMRMRKPSELVLAYTRQMMAWLLFIEPDARSRIGILGLGAGSLLRFVLRNTRAAATTVEWSPSVVAACRSQFRLPESKRSRIDVCDAAQWVRRLENMDRHQVLMVDLYDGAAQGPVCDSFEFYDHCRKALCEPGVMTVNLFGNHPSFARNLENIRRAFGGRVLVLPEIDEGNTVVIALKGPMLNVTVRQLLDRADEIEARYGLAASRWARALLARNTDDNGFSA
jgi:spermidine synthase